ncbi:P-loop containing nucleoside triphosphate hydrolase protein [Epithele typhae]|uniref:P-loop containing nucleoside triphosphate hydrolase protein n=1 Tax=Epithele typhae TaxID=378194 RepID=UPI00200746DF|nr:P-loop containing nucleoside triphosphate hydrolase protein [Epithele typhae]KAH9929008.1 P-loop containing nucleoside triphosphate hydrolase protein [Epithele typhae]
MEARLCWQAIARRRMPRSSTTATMTHPPPRPRSATRSVGYASALAFGSIITRKHGQLLESHLSFVLLVTLATYTFRDFAPLFFHSRNWPEDAQEGVLLWIKLSLLFVAAAAIPFVTPHTYVPLHPEEPVEVPSPEQTASLLSRALFSWIDPTIAKASRVEHLPLDEFPPLADIDETKNLTKEVFPKIDPFELGKDEHIFWGLMRAFSESFLPLAFGDGQHCCFAGIRAPLAVNGLLADIEANGPQSELKSWAWIVLMFVGPVFVTLTEEQYMWIIYRINFCMQALVTELLFQHALRIRVKSERSGDGQGLNDEKDKNMIGKINNLVTSDIENIKEGNKFWMQLFIRVPVLIGVAIFFVWRVLGWSALVGLASIVILLPIPGYLSSWIQTYQAGMMSRTDARVQLINETLNVVRMIKLFGWEHRVEKQIEEKRDAELSHLTMQKYLELINNLINFSIPLVTMAITFGTYTLVAKQDLNAASSLTPLSAFLMIQMELHIIFYAVPVSTQAKISLDRINDFLHDTELLDDFEPRRPASATAAFARPSRNDSVLGLAHTTFTWSAASATPFAAPDASALTGRHFALRINEPLVFPRGKISLVVGPTGSGKTSLLMALLGEMHATPEGPEAFVGLPRAGGVAYAAQESWVQNETIRDNILFGAPFDDERYNEVIRQCALDRDLSLFDAGDMTEVGEKGITLSGGQKARVTLARAVYSAAETLLLDDVLAALDVHTGRWIVEKCFKGDLVRGRTVVFVSHNVALTRPIADFVVAVGNDGRIASQGSLDKVLQEDAELKDEVEVLARADQEIDVPEASGEAAADLSKKDGKLVVAEEIGTGRVGWGALQLYMRNVAAVPWIYWVFYIALLFLTHASINSQSYFLGYWAAQYETHDRSEISVWFYLAGYLGLVAAALIVYGICWSIHVYGRIRASRIIHRDLVVSVLGTTLRWLDTTPISRIITRCTSDIQGVDGSIPQMLHSLLEGSVYLTLRIVSIAIVLPIFIIPAAIVLLLGWWISSIYMRAQLSVKREMSNAQAPVLGHFGGAISGLVSIRAYGAQEAFKQESYKRMDRFTRAGLTYAALNRWVTVRVDIMGVMLTTVLAVYLTYSANISASNAGFALAMAVGFSSYILSWLRVFNDFQVTGTSLERIHQYMVIEQEPKPTPEGVPPAYWPASGGLRVEKLSARYSREGPRVLHELSFEVKSGERIGIVGRTGSGKSSLTLSLLRCIVTEGKVFYDGLPTDGLNLDALRSNVTIIPQVPELLSGTLRQNLDPLGQHDDMTLNDALRSAGLSALQERTGSGDESRAKLTLDSEIAGGGGNLSVGQRQIIALARAMVRNSKLLILDEDYDTDAIIQKSLREELGKDVTVLTVAHRLQSIMDADKIMVLEAGRLVEYAPPSELLKKTGGYFRQLVDGSDDRATLYAMAGLPS